MITIAACAGPVPPAASPTPTVAPSQTVAPTPTVAPTTEDEAIALAIRVREALGLRSDIEWVRMVQSDPSSVMSNLGILVTPEELAEITANQAVPDDYSALVAYGIRHADQFGGMFIDNAIGHPVMLFTADLERHAAAIAELPRGATVDVRQCTYTEAELVAIQEGIDFNELRAQGIELLSISVDVMHNVVVLEGKSNDPTAKTRLEERYGGRLVANIVPLPGPWANLPAGDGWRLVSAVERDSNWAYTVRAATTQEHWSALWTEMSPGLPEPPIDFATDIAAIFGEATGGPGNCSERRLDDVVIDVPRELVYARISDPLAPRGCDDMLGGASIFVVALARAALPPMPFTLQLRDPLQCCEDTGRITVGEP